MSEVTVNFFCNKPAGSFPNMNQMLSESEKKHKTSTVPNCSPASDILVPNKHIVCERLTVPVSAYVPTVLINNISSLHE